MPPQCLKSIFNLLLGTLRICREYFDYSKRVKTLKDFVVSGHFLNVVPTVELYLYDCGAGVQTV